MKRRKSTRDDFKPTLSWLGHLLSLVLLITLATPPAAALVGRTKVDTIDGLTFLTKFGFFENATATLHYSVRDIYLIRLS